jgi:hypothetical protein
MRPLMQNSVGPKRLAKLLRELHMLRHDRIELQYLYALHQQKLQPSVLSHISQAQPEPFSAFDDGSKYAGFVPTSTYLRGVYTSMINRLRPLMDKQMMLLDGKILKGDHSFKLVKHVAKVDGAPTFTALYTLCNEYEEIRMQALVPSKALSHLRKPFQALKDAFDFYGHDQPEIFFTDNVKTDRNFLFDTLPSLKKDCVIGDRFGNLPAAEISNDRIVYCSNPTTISAASTRILESLCHEQQIFVGFDCEWPVSFERGKIITIFK